jgi:hypothetical protein
VSKFRVENGGSMLMVSRKPVTLPFTAIKTPNIIGEDVHYGLCGYDNVQPGKWLPVFWRNMLPLSAERMKLLQ